jgi:Arc/MetJ-type ribon-helix-helix transcriptional regulator
MALAKNLPDHVKAYIERQVAEGRFETEEAVIVDAVEHVMETSYRWEEDEELLAAIAEADRGEVYEWTPELMAEIRRESEENHRRGHQVRDDIKY